MVAQLFAMPLEEAFAQGLWLNPVVHSEADYRHPIRFGERCTVQLRVAARSARSITYAYRILRKSDARLCAELQTIHVFIDAQTARAGAIPPAYLAGLQRLGLVDPPTP